MDDNQRKSDFLTNIGRVIPRLFEAINEGNERAEYILGSRTIKDRQVRLVLTAEVVDPGSNPLATHSVTPEVTNDASEATTEAIRQSSGQEETADAVRD